MRHPDYLVACDKNIEIKTMEHNVGGEPMQIPTCSFINREKMYDLVNEFIETKQIPMWLEWIDLYDIDFENEFND